MKNNKAITLLELLIATSLLIFVIFAATSIYLTGLRMSRDAQSQAQSQRNAMVAMAHMEKHIREGASECNVTRGGNRLEFMQYAPQPTITSRYDFDSAQISYDPNIDLLVTGDETVIGTNINSCAFTEHHSDTMGIIVDISITATDNNGGNPYTLTSSVTARYTGTPPVY